MIITNTAKAASFIIHVPESLDEGVSIKDVSIIVTNHLPPKEGEREYAKNLAVTPLPMDKVDEAGRVTIINNDTLLMFSTDDGRHIMNMAHSCLPVDGIGISLYLHWRNCKAYLSIPKVYYWRGEYI